MSLREEVVQQISIAIDGLHSAINVSPTTVAMRVFEHYNKPGFEQHLAYASIEHLKQLARSVLAREHEPEQRAKGRVDEQDDLFGDLLQDRYPIKVKRGDEPQYKLRQHLTRDEVQWNVDRMRKVGSTLLRHADALQAWDESCGNRDAA